MLGALVVVVTIALFVRAGTAACAEAVVRAGSYSTGCKETLLNLILNIAKGTTDPRVGFILQVNSSQFTNL